MATQTSLPLSPIGERLQVQFSTNASWRSVHFFGRRKKTSKGKRQTNRRVDGVRRFVFFSLFLLTGFLVSRGMVRIGVGRFFFGGVDQCEGHTGSFEPVAKREDDPLGTYFCS